MNTFSVVKPHVCHTCGKRFGRSYNLWRHAESAHGEHESPMDEIYDDREIGENRSEQLGGHNYESGFKKLKIQDSETESCETESMQYEDEAAENESESETEEENDDSSDEDECSSELEDNATYQDWLEEAKGATEEMWTEKYEKYLNENMSEDQAKEKANRKTLWAVKRIFFNTYKEFLLSYLYLEDNDTHQEIVEDLKEKIDKGMTYNKAFNRVLPKHQTKFEGLFQHDEDDNNQEGSDD